MKLHLKEGALRFHIWSVMIILLLHASCITGSYNISVSFKPSQQVLQVGSRATIHFNVTNDLHDTLNISLYAHRQGIISFFGEKAYFDVHPTPPNQTFYDTFIVKGEVPASNLIISLNCTNENTSNSCQNETNPNEYLKVDVVHSLPLLLVIKIVGWIYFFAWSISFYPQIITNFQRKSVVGLDFNFLALNITGFIFYSTFNCGMFFSNIIQAQYFNQSKNQYGTNPVADSDVAFGLHAVLMCAITIFQCFIYERGGQRVAWACVALLSLMWTVAFVLIVPTSIGKLQWLLYLQILSYIKLSITLMKYIPQAYYNFRRKSTIGWSIGNVLLDFTGGAFSILAMFFQAYNFNDWNEIFGDFTKFGLGAISLCFDIVFIVQHYVLYYGRQPYAFDDKQALVNADGLDQDSQGEPENYYG